MKVTAIGIDLAKNVFQVHGVDEHGRVVLRKQLRRSQVMEFFAQRIPCLVGMEACGGAHEWARRLTTLGYTVKLMAPQFVKPYVKTNKIGDARNFRSGRQLAAWLGLVPRQHSSGGKSLLLGISKRGDCYLRTLLIHGARAVIRCAGPKKKDEVTATAGISTTQSRN